jgi:hypothetical protein
MAELATGLLVCGAGAGIAYACKCVYCAAGKTDLTLIIDNHLEDVHLTSSVLIVDGCKIIESPTSEIAPKTSMKAKFKKRATSSKLEGALICELQRTSEDPYKFYVFMAWQASCFRSTRIYTSLLFNQANATCGADLLADIYQKLSHKLVKTRDGHLTQSYTLYDGSGIGLWSYDTGRKHRKLYLTITNAISQADATQILWMGPSVNAQNVEQNIKQESIMEKVAETFITEVISGLAQPSECHATCHT